MAQEQYVEIDQAQFSSANVRSEKEIRDEIKNRQQAIAEREVRMKPLAADSDAWKTLMAANNTDRKVIAVLYWVLGEDLLWE